MSSNHEAQELGHPTEGSQAPTSLAMPSARGSPPRLEVSEEHRSGGSQSMTAGVVPNQSQGKRVRTLSEGSSARAPRRGEAVGPQRYRSPSPPSPTTMSFMSPTTTTLGDPGGKRQRSSHSYTAGASAGDYDREDDIALQQLLSASHFPRPILKVKVISALSDRRW
jgi:hypothetical protein